LQEYSIFKNQFIQKNAYLKPDKADMLYSENYDEVLTF